MTLDRNKQMLCAYGLQTSALDTHTEHILLQNINNILKEKSRTSVFIAHRLRTIYDCDQIIVLQDGQVAEMGTHTELVEAGGVYAGLWNGEQCSVFACEREYILKPTTAQESGLLDASDSDREQEK